MLPFVLLGIPAATGLGCLLLVRKPIVQVLNLLGATSTIILGLTLAAQVFTRGPISGLNGLLYIDALSAFVLAVVSLVTFLAALYSVGYMGREEEEGIITEKQLSRYYLWFHLFVFTMLTSLMANNLGVVWVAIEATTLASALLVGFYNKETSLEAAWKYIIICTVGITFALFGTILAYYSSVRVLGEASDALNWTTLMQVAKHLDPKLMKLSFVFILVGYGTKAGLAPMHTWLPDAHSQAPSPVSAVLSGVLLNCALYGIIRFHIITSGALGPEYSSRLLLIFGLLSVGLAIPFIAVQSDFKRLLAYSSVEHMGIIATGLGIGGRLGLYGAMLHLFNHAVGKSLMFFVAGNLTQKYKTRKIARIRAALQTMPVTGVVLIVGAFAIGGTPPFNIFLSEFIIASASFKQGNFLAGGLFLLFIALIFAGITYHLSKMAFGNANGRIVRGELNVWTAAVLLVPLFFVLTMGVYVPPLMDNVLGQVVAVLKGGQ